MVRNDAIQTISRNARRWWGLLLVALLWVSVAQAQVKTLELTRLPAQSLGTALELLIEKDQPLELAQAQALQREGQFRPGQQVTLTFGIGAPAVWLHLQLLNPLDHGLEMMLLAGTTWTDQLEVFVVQEGRLGKHWQSGDENPVMAGLAPALGYAVPVQFAPGRSELYLRIASIDPLVLPVELMSPDVFHGRQTLLGYCYGFIYGFLMALCAYNFMLFVGLRNRSYLYYSFYLMCLIAMNMAYTGHGLAWLWPGQIGWQRYVILVLMMLFSGSGLLFASRFLGLAEHAPRALKVVQWFCGLGAVAMGVCLLTGSHLGAAYVSFVFLSLFAFGMVALGVLTAGKGQVAGRYFLAAVLCGAIGATLTVLSVWGWLPFTVFTYHAVELGVILEATLLALALAYQVRQHQQASRISEKLARLDPLTGLLNRRACLALAGPGWSTAQRGDRPLSVIMLDIDHFKQINDQYGHDAGDRALVTIANLLSQQIRTGDILSRWGGEEFLLILPETDLAHACAFAERLRQSIAEIKLPLDHTGAVLTASLGVATRHGQRRLDELINAADVQLYDAKRQGRNRVSSARP